MTTKSEVGAETRKPDEVSMCDVGTYQELVQLIKQARNAAETASEFAMGSGIKDFRDLEVISGELQHLRYRAEGCQHEAERLKKASKGR